MTSGGRAMLDPGDLDRMLSDGEVDTVVCALPDLWGRLVGKRVTARTFRRLMREGGGLHASLYLFVVDMDMEPQPATRLHRPRRLPRWTRAGMPSRSSWPSSPGSAICRCWRSAAASSC